MTRCEVQVAQGRQRNDEQQVPADGMRDWSEPETSELIDAAHPLSRAIQGRHIEQMYELANIFASIFDALPDAPGDAIATTREAT